MTERHVDYVDRDNNNDEIDLVELIANLWKEKWTIALCTLLSLAVAIVYLLATKPVYLATAQLQAPTEAQLIAINNTGLIKTTPEETLGKMLSALSSDKIKAKLIENNKQLFTEAYNAEANNVTYEKYGNSLFTIEFPKEAQEGSLEPQIYTLKQEGTDQVFITRILDSAVQAARSELINEWQTDFNTIKQEQLTRLNREYNLLDNVLTEQKNNKIAQLTESDSLREKQLTDELNTRKVYLLNRRKDRIIELEEAARIAASLNITQPSSIKLLSRSTSQSSTQVEVNTDLKEDNDPLYLRGTNLLNAELTNLKALADDIFLDNRVREIERELLKLANNRDIEVLKARQSNQPFNENLQTLSDEIKKIENIFFPEKIFTNIQTSSSISLNTPIRPKKALTLVIAVFFGGILGVFTAIARIIVRNRNISKK